MVVSLLRNRMLTLLAGVCVYFMVGNPAHAAQDLPIIKPVQSCASLSSVKWGQEIDAGVKITQVEELKTPQGDFCKVSATLSPDIGVEVALPEAKWTQRMLQVGCGGLCGNINLSLSNANGCVPAMNGEFAVAANNMGHSGSMMDASWAEDPQKRIDFAYRANHVTAQFTQALIKAYYGQSHKYAYFMGCSDGGREALMEAQRYPHDFNGISAGAPAAWFSMQNSFFHGWNVIANLRRDGSPILLQSRLPLLHSAVLSHCPTLSGVKDGILGNPFACTFSRSWIKQCAPEQRDQSDCMTAEELDVVQKLYQGAHDQQGHQLAPAGLPIGSELRWPVPALSSGHSMSEMMALPALQYVLLPGAKQNFSKVGDFAFNDVNFAKIAQLAPLYNATNTNLKPYQAAGGKLIVWHGLADDSISPAGTLAYFHGVQAYMGTKTVDSFMRLFLLPGVAHCGNGEGPDQVDLLTALMHWTEDETPPKSLITGKREHTDSMPHMPPMNIHMGKPPSGMDASIQFHGLQKPSTPFATAKENVSMTRPVFTYPYIAKYNGTGDVNDADNYHPVKLDDKPMTLSQPISNMIGPDNQRDYTVVNGQLMAK